MTYGTTYKENFDRKELKGREGVMERRIVGRDETWTMERKTEETGRDRKRDIAERGYVERKEE